MSALVTKLLYQHVLASRILLKQVKVPSEAKISLVMPKGREMGQLRSSKHDCVSSFRLLQQSLVRYENK